MSTDDLFMAGGEPWSGQQFDVVLKPLSHPELGEIRIEERLFAVGRNEAPFASYDRQLMADLSRRHARIFWEGGALYVADLGSKNGTSVNGAPVREKPAPLHDGDELRLGRDLAYRVRTLPRAARRPRPASAPALTLTPQRDDHGLQPIVITQFPFLISKADETFARYKEAYPHQVNYLSRRHAHLFLKGDTPHVEDLGSTNGTFVGGTRLEEQAVPLHDGDLLAFAGSHFAYKVALAREGESEPTQTQSMPPPAAAEAAVAPAEPEPHAGPTAEASADKTTFVAAADSFLDIFCVDPAPQPDEVNEEAAPAEEAGAPGRPKSRAGIFLREIGKAFSGGEGGQAKRALKWALPVLALLIAGALGLYFSGAGERDIKALMAEGRYAEAAAAAEEALARHPEDAAMKALGTEALLKARLPEWVASVKAGSFERAAAALAEMQAGAGHNPEARALIAELAWLGELAQFSAGRGAEAPIRMHADEARIKALLQRWNDDPKAHQKALTQIALFVPEFRDVHAEALTALRRLESDESVYLAAIERLDAAIAAELAAGRPEALAAMLDEYAEKYPRLAGLDVVRQDLARYLALERALTERRLGAIAALSDKPAFATPPFQARFEALGPRLPPPEVLEQYRASARAWREGQAEPAMAGLKAIGGPWADAAAGELARRQTLLREFKDLQQARGARGYDERLVAFYAGLDAGEDGYFLKATEAEVAARRDQAVARARELVGRAQGLWRQYRSTGGIGGEQRAEAAVSGPFRTQAKLLAEALASATQGARIHALLKTDDAAAAARLSDEIAAEAESQRRSLQNLQTELAPDLLKAKLALIAGEGP